MKFEMKDHLVHERGHACRELNRQAAFAQDGQTGRVEVRTAFDVNHLKETFIHSPEKGPQ